jgi:type VI secretion system protein ImpG
MSRNDQLFRGYLDEMHALNEFVLNYHTDHKFSGLRSEMSSEDPDVNRLLESIGFFSARIHDSVIRNVQSYRYRLYQQLFPYLLTPTPSSGILSGSVSGLLTDPVTIDKGTDFIMRTPEGKEFFWQTRHSLTLYPITLRSIKVLPGNIIGSTLLLHFVCKHPLHNRPDPLSLLIDYIGDVRSSFGLLTYIKEYLTSVRVHFGPATSAHDYDRSDWQEMDLPIYGSAGMKEGIDQNEPLHPIEIERLFFKDPRQELFIHLAPPKVDEPIFSFSLEFNFSEPWPKRIIANKDIFKLNCVPIINLRQMPARPTWVDGTITQHTIMSGQEDAGFELCKHLGVYQLDKDGMTPLFPGVIARLSPCYEIESRVIEQRGRFFSNLITHYPGAFEEPVQIVVEAVWHQPNFEEYRDSEAEFRPYAFNILGVSWEWAFLPMSRVSQPDLSQTSEALLDILQISHKRFFSTEDIKSIMQLMGTITDGPYRSVYAAFKSARYEFRTLDSTGITPGFIIYFLTFEREEIESNDQMFRLFIQHLEIVLNHWSDEKEIRVSLEN